MPLPTFPPPRPFEPAPHPAPPAPTPPKAGSQRVARLAVALLACLGLLTGVGAAVASAQVEPGDLDGSWGTNGLAAAFTDTASGASAMQLVPGGGVALAGAPGIATLGPTGAVSMQHVFDGPILNATGLVRLSDGAFVVAGVGRGGDGTNPYDNDASWIVEKRTATGALDPAWATAGIDRRFISTDSNWRVGRTVVSGVADAGDGKVLVAGSGRCSGSTAAGCVKVLRYTADGQIDATFGDPTTHVASFQIPVSETSFAPATVLRMALQPGDGKIVLAGETQIAGADRPMVMRLEPDGSLDESFGDHGHVVLTQAGVEIGEPDAVTLAPDGDILVGGLRQVMRLAPNGDPDTGFGTGGISTLPDRNYVNGLSVAPDGRVLVTGQNYGGNTRAFLTRLLSDGTIDPTLAQRYLVGPSYFVYSSAVSVIPAPDGRSAFVAGSTYVSSSDSIEHMVTWRVSLVGTPVANTRPPSLPSTGHPGATSNFRVGEQLSVDDPGSWSGSRPITVIDRWERCPAKSSPAGDCTPVGSGSDYTIVQDDLGTWLRVVETASNAEGPDGVVRSQDAGIVASPPVADPQQPPVLTPATPHPGDEVSVSSIGGWSGVPDPTTDIFWSSCPTAQYDMDACEPAGATGASITATAAHVGRYLVASIFRSNPAGSDAVARGAVQVTAPDGGGSADPAPTFTAGPQVSPAGPVDAGTTLTAVSDGTVTPAGAQLARRWERCGAPGQTPLSCAPISGATDRTYATQAADAGHLVRLHVTATTTGGTRAADAAPVEVRAAAERVTDPVKDPSGGGAGAAVKPAATSISVPATGPGTPVASSGTRVDTATAIPMPDLRGTRSGDADETLARLGIHAAIRRVISDRRTPPQVGGHEARVGDIIEQSTPPRALLAGSIPTPHPLTLVVFGGDPGPPAAAGHGPCTVHDLASLRGTDLDDALALIKGACRDVDFNFAKGNADEPEIRKFAGAGPQMKVTVRMPDDPAAYDLTVWVRGGARTGTTPTLGLKDWALTADQSDVFGVTVTNRAGMNIIGAKVLVDGRKVGADDKVVRTAGSGIGIVPIHPERPGLVSIVVQQTDAAGNSVLGFGQVRVVDRSDQNGFDTILGDRFTRDGHRFVLDTRSRARASAAGTSWLNGMGAYFGRLGDFVESAFATHPASAEGLKAAAAAAPNVSPLQALIGATAGAGASLLRTVGGFVITLGGGNLIDIHKAEVITAGGGNVITAGGGNAVATDVGRIAESAMRNGTGSMIELPKLDAAGKVITSGGGNVITAGGGNVITAGGGNVITAGGGNVITAGGGNVITAGGGN